ncbi:MAG TPA: iron ABC transporter permease [Anaerolineales bacterium]|nr:iron ABC transporter permease [Anaerolineales bacterium]
MRKPPSRSTVIILLWIAPVCFLLLFYFYPLGSILSLSLARSQQGWLAPFIEAIHSPTARDALGFTFWQATLSTLLTLALGLPGAYLFAHYNFRGKALLQALTGIPFLMPTLVVATAFNALLGPNGWINIGLMQLFKLSGPPVQFTNSLGAILIAHVFYNTTIILRTVGDFWSHLDPRMNQAARMLGASRWQAIRWVTLPLLTPAIAAAALLVFIFDFTSFGVILILGGPHFSTLEVEIYYQTISLFNLPMAAVLSLIQLACTLGLTVLYTRLIRRVSIPVSLKSQSVTQKRFTTNRTRLTAGIIFSVLLAILILPLAALAFRSVTRLEANRGTATVAPPSLTLDYYRQLDVNSNASIFFAPPATAIAVSLGYAVATMILALLLGFPAAIALSRDPSSTVSHGLDAILMLPLGTSAVTLGLGFIVALGKPPLDLRSSWLLVPLAHTLVAFPFVVRNLTPALRSIRPRMRQAASVLGASPRDVIRYIDIPLIGRSMIVAATFAFTISLGEFGATSLIARPQFPTIPIAIYNLITRPGELNYGQALALSTLLMVVAGAGMMVINRLRIGDVGEF